MFGYCLEIVEHVDQLVALTENNQMVSQPSVGEIRKLRLLIQPTIEKFEEYANFEQKGLIYDQSLSVVNFEIEAENCEIGLKSCDAEKMAKEAIQFSEKALHLCATKN